MMLGKTVFEHLFPHLFDKIRDTRERDRLIEFWKEWESSSLLQPFIVEAAVYDTEVDKPEYRAGALLLLLLLLLLFCCFVFFVVVLKERGAVVIVVVVVVVVVVVCCC